MSFGFSVSDFVVVGGIIVDIINCLSESGGAKSDYQELLRELESLQQALRHLDRLQKRPNQSAESLDSIKYAALSCRRPLEEFLRHAKKYENSLGLWAKNNAAKSVTEKLKWSFGTGKKDRVAKLQSYLSIHVGTINVLLAEHNLEQLDLMGQKAELDHTTIHQRIEDARKIIDNIQENVVAQKLVVEKSKSMLRNLCQMVSGEPFSSLMSLTDMVSRVCVCIQQTYGVLLRIEASLPAPDIRRTFFQDPLAIEDAEGVRFPVPSEYDFKLLNDIIKLRFEVGPLSKDVRVGNYELFKTLNGKDVITADTRLLPGTAITMALLMREDFTQAGCCPMPRCRSDRSLPVPGGGRLCSDCNVWFDCSSKKRKRLESLSDAAAGLSGMASRSESRVDRYEPVIKQGGLPDTVDNLSTVKNIRLAEEELRDETKDEIGASERKAGPCGYEDALDYLNGIKAYYVARHRISAFREFLEILETHRRESLPIQDTYTQVEKLLRDAPELLKGFKRFMPSSAVAATNAKTASSYHDMWMKRAIIAIGVDENEAAYILRRRENLCYDLLSPGISGPWVLHPYDHELMERCLRYGKGESGCCNSEFGRMLPRGVGA